jgi:hypothetical protein
VPAEEVEAAVEERTPVRRRKGRAGRRRVVQRDLLRNWMDGLMRASAFRRVRLVQSQIRAV